MNLKLKMVSINFSGCPLEQFKFAGCLGSFKHSNFFPFPTLVCSNWKSSIPRNYRTQNWGCIILFRDKGCRQQQPLRARNSVTEFEALDDDDLQDGGVLDGPQRRFREQGEEKDYDRDPEFAEILGSCLDDPDKAQSKETVFMKFPASYKGAGSNGENSSLSNSYNGDQVCKLKKSLYGLKQAPRQWFTRLTEVLKEEGFSQSRCDYSLFSKIHQGGLIVLLVYVDDIIIAGDNKENVAAVKSLLSSKLHMKDLGKARYFHGLEIDKTSQGIFLCQKKYISDLLKEYGLLKCRKLQVPLDATVKLTEDMGDLLPHPEAYQKLIGKLIYLTLTRPDISFSVQTLSHFMHRPTTAHYQAAKRVLRYLSGSINQGVLLASEANAKLQAYCDSDWAGCPNTRRSTSGSAYSWDPLLSHGNPKDRM